MANYLWLLGTAGMVAMELSYVPQLVRLYRLKRAEEVSYLFAALNVVGRLIALAYSLLKGDPVFIGGFLVGTLLRGTLLVEVVWYRRGELARRSEAEGAVAHRLEAVA
jgi:lipid-A-disaccharide synthase-like uncharacterized protein